VTEFIKRPFDYSFEKENIRKEYIGWIKLVDENGFPNITYAPRGI